MKIFLDTANRELIKKWLPTGLIDGITTNPSHLSKEGSDVKQVISDICAMVPGPISVEVVEKTPEAVYAQAKHITTFGEQVVVKIPCASQYFPVIHKLVQEGVSINVTLVFTPLQALMVAKLGVMLISPFVGRWDDIGVDGFTLLEETVNIKNLYDFDAEILAASVRSPLQWQKIAQLGVDAVTVPPAVFEQAINHPLTEKGMAIFDADWNKLGVNGSL